MFRDEEERRSNYQVVQPSALTWSLSNQVIKTNGQPLKTLSITLLRPPLTEEEIVYKKGKYLSADQRWYFADPSTLQSACRYTKPSYHHTKNLENVIMYGISKAN